LILEAYSAARRNKPARDLSRHKMLHNTSPCGPEIVLLGHSLFRSSLVQDPDARTRQTFPQIALPPKGKR